MQSIHALVDRASMSPVQSIHELVDPGPVQLLGCNGGSHSSSGSLHARVRRGPVLRLIRPEAVMIAAVVLITPPIATATTGPPNQGPRFSVVKRISLLTSCKGNPRSLRNMNSNYAKGRNIDTKSKRSPVQQAADSSLQAAPSFESILASSSPV